MNAELRAKVVAVIEPELRRSYRDDRWPTTATILAGLIADAIAVYDAERHDALSAHERVDQLCAMLREIGQRASR